MLRHLPAPFAQFANCGTDGRIEELCESREEYLGCLLPTHDGRQLGRRSHRYDLEDRPDVPFDGVFARPRHGARLIGVVIRAIRQIRPGTLPGLAQQ